jgi:hypothetical protein
MGLISENSGGSPSPEKGSVPFGAAPKKKFLLLIPEKNFGALLDKL